MGGKQHGSDCGVGVEDEPGVGLKWGVFVEGLNYSISVRYPLMDMPST